MKIFYSPQKFTSFELVSAVRLIHTTVMAPKLCGKKLFWISIKLLSWFEKKSVASWDSKLANFNSIGKGFIHSTALNFDTIYPEIIWGRFKIRYLDDIDEALFIFLKINCFEFYLGFFCLTFLNWGVMDWLKWMIWNLMGEMLWSWMKKFDLWKIVMRII